MNLIKSFSNKPILVNRLLLALWAALSILAACKQYFRDSYNNYKIFKYVFINTTNQHRLYEAQPDFFLDLNHYGPVFSLVIAPFALLPNWAGMIGWALFTSLTLFYAINKLPLSHVQRNLILLICTNELFTSLVNVQSNPFIAALIILSFVYAAVNEFKSGFSIALGFLVKLYGIVGFAFILFAKSYWKYIAGFLLALIIIAALPILISSPDFQMQAYQDWFRTLSEKNGQNVTQIMQNISAIGLLQRTISSTLPVIWVLGIGLLLMLAMVVANFGRFNNSRFRFLLLSAVLLFTVLFSTSSESSTYIIAFPGVAIWYVTKPQRSVLDHILFVFAILLTSLSPTDIFPPQARLFIKQYSLKALPCLLVWLEIIRESIALRLKPVEA